MDNKFTAIYQNYDWCYDKFITKGMTCEEIANMYGFSKRVIEKWCHEKFKLCYKEQKKLNDIQKQLIMFSLLGDGHIDRRETKPLFIVSHSEKQKDYLFWKYDILKDCCKSQPSYIKPQSKLFSGKEYMCRGQYRFSTRVIYDLYSIRNMNKIDIIKQLNEFGLSIYILDDASRNKDGWTLCYASFTEEEKQTFINVLKNRFKIESIRNKDDRYLYIPAKFSRVLDDIILKNIPNHLDIIKYKILSKQINRKEY